MVFTNVAEHMQVSLDTVFVEMVVRDVLAVRVPVDGTVREMPNCSIVDSWNKNVEIEMD